MSLRRSIVANFAGQAWSALIGIAFLPLYIRYLGIEAWGLVGVFAILQAWFSLLDAGMTSVLTREAARWRAGQSDAQSLRDLLRGTELVFGALAVAASLATMVAAPWVAHEWLGANHLPASTIAVALTVMAVTACARCLEGVYRGGAIGLDRQVEVNLVGAVLATVRAVGGVAVLHWLSPTITAFFTWQLLNSIVSTAWLARLVYARLDRRTNAPFSFDAWRTISGFAGGLVGISGLALVLTQLDKVLLSRLLPLADYGYYTLASTLTGALAFIVTPISQAYFPRFSELTAPGHRAALTADYHAAAQLVTVCAGAVACTLVAFGDVLLGLWFADSAIVDRAGPLLRVLALGSLFNALMWIPYQLQLAHGQTRLAFVSNVCAALLVVPALLWSVPRYGAVGGAWAWVALNAGYLLLAAPRMFRSLLPGERGRWYLQDLAAPLAAGGVAAFVTRMMWPHPMGRVEAGWVLLTSTALIAGAALLGASTLRAALRQVLWDRTPPVASR